MTLFSLNKLPHSIFIFQNNLDDYNQLHHYDSGYATLHKI